MNLETKQSLRKETLTKLNSLEKNQKALWDKQIAEQINKVIENFTSCWKLQYGCDPMIGLYIPLLDEPDILKYLTLSPTQRSFPIRRDQRFMDYVRYAEDLKTLPIGEYFLNLKNSQHCLPDIILIPGLLFDKKGYRLGRGRGYFDVYLESHNCLSIGLGYSWQVVKKLTIEDHDRNVDVLVTENEVLKLTKNSFLFD